MGIAGIITFIAGWFICNEFNNITLPKYIFELVKIIVVMLACGIIYTFFNIIFKMEYAKELIARLKK